MRYINYDNNYVYFKFVKKDKIVTVYQEYTSNENFINQLPESFQSKNTIIVGKFYKLYNDNSIRPYLLCINGVNFYVYSGPDIQLNSYSNKLNIKYNSDSAFIGQYRLD